MLRKKINRVTEIEVPASAVEIDYTKDISRGMGNGAPPPPADTAGVNKDPFPGMGDIDEILDEGRQLIDSLTTTINEWLRGEVDDSGESPEDNKPSADSTDSKPSPHE